MSFTVAMKQDKIKNNHKHLNVIWSFLFWDMIHQLKVSSIPTIQTIIHLLTLD